MKKQNKYIRQCPYYPYPYPYYTYYHSPFYYPIADPPPRILAPIVGPIIH